MPGLVTIQLLFLILQFGNNAVLGQFTSEQELYLTYLFNTTIEDIENIANEFTFTSAEVEDDVAILVFLPDSEPFNLTQQNKQLLINATKIIVYIHGYESFGTDVFSVEIAETYNSLGGYLVLNVDWGILANKSYPTSASAVNAVGDNVAQTLWELSDENVDVISRIHVIGHSLGAQVSAFVGKWIIENTPTQVPRVTGLDPAGPLFQTVVPRPVEFRLNALDGTTVDCIITDKGLAGVFGNCGKYDFYVNSGGPIQPACFNNSIADLTDPIAPISCSHLISFDMYRDSIINPDSFIATQCSSSLLFDLGLCDDNTKNFMGFELDDSAPAGSYYINTNATNNLPQ